MTSPPGSPSEGGGHEWPAAGAAGDEAAAARKRPRLRDGACSMDSPPEPDASSTATTGAFVVTEWTEAAAPENEGTIRAYDDNDDDDDDGSSDSSVQFLLHLPKPAPSRPIDASAPLSSAAEAAHLPEAEDCGSIVARSGDAPGRDAPRSLPEGAASAMTDAMEVGCRSEAPTSAASIAPLRSAYLQNLAEVCHTILQDHRWRVGAAREPLFQWERGDDLSVVRALGRRFLPPSPNRRAVGRPCGCLLCRDEATAPERGPPGTAAAAAAGPAFDRDVPEEDDDRGLYLYCRLFYRKGPWFRLDDIYKRYYASQREPPASADHGKGSMEETLRALQRLLEDLARLHTKGFIRGFSSEEECGRVVGESLLSNLERGQVLFRLAMGSKRGRVVPCPPGPTVLKQMKRQRPLFVDGGAGVAASCLPVRRHVVAVMAENLARALVRRAHPNHEPNPKEVAQVKGRIESMVQEAGLAVDVMAGLRLRAEPHRTLARCGRLYLCATSGPGTMRGDGTNGWRSLIPIDAPLAILGIDPPGIHSWHMAEYPGLKARFGLSSYPFQRTFQFMFNGASEQQVFASHAQFFALECCIELRAHIDFTLELENLLKYNERRMARGLRPLGDASFQSGDDNRDIDFLWLTRPSGRERLVRTLLRVCGREDDAILYSIEQDIEAYSDAFSSKCHQIIFAAAAIASHVLCHRNQTISNADYDMMTSKPWLRHLWWDGNLAYILWDAIPILEKKSHYYAVLALETLLFGKRICGHPLLVIPEISKASDLASILLSRRTRGKAFVRLFVDYRHLLKEGRSALQNDKKKSEEIKARQAKSMREFFDRVILHRIATSSIPFSSVRELARPLRQPLSVILRHVHCLEAFELGLRLQGGSSALHMDTYSEWAPKIDRSLANAIVNDENGPGSRCTYIGFEDENRASPLSVEELAIEFYNTGRLPYDDKKGGWRGFHDEGSHLHSLFRVICSRPILGTDWGCGHARRSHLCPTVQLSPYQGAPFDLLIGHEVEDRPRLSFYANRASTIQLVLQKLETLSQQQLSDLVYDSVLARFNYMQTANRNDPTSLDDLRTVRTLSLIAAGLGGKALSSIFRCFCFDYRHFRGGMPDLLLIRASIRDDSGNTDIIDLNKWIGESFSIEDEAAHRAALMPGDEDFLGCSMGESGNIKANKRNRVRNKAASSTLNDVDDIEHNLLLPERLQLIFDDREVCVETMLVEVKSANDRLDSRQQDWLNVLDLHANARVCKFEKSRSKEKPEL